MNTNPIIKLDYPDPDVIRVGNIYYMITTSMYFFPGGEILKSYDLIHWEHASFVFDRLDSTDAQRLVGGKNIYSAGMWAATFRYHEGMFYVMFVCNDTGKTYLYTSESIYGEWKKSNVKGFYHDCSLLFDDGRVFVVYGNREIHLTELDKELTGPLKGGLDRVIVRDSNRTPLGYEGSHIYKINGRYYVFFIHSLEDRWFRAESCFSSDSLEGKFVGGDIFVNDMGYCNSGVAQGGIVDTPFGDWYGIFFQDRGAVGRIPVLVPLKWDDNSVLPIMSDDINEIINPVTKSLNKDYKYESLAGNDNFDTDDGPSYGLKSIWQFNHEPQTDKIFIDKENKCFVLTTDTVVDNVLRAVNTVTQKLFFPKCHVEVTIDASEINDGDFAGLICLQAEYAFEAITKENGRLYLIMVRRIEDNNGNLKGEIADVQGDDGKLYDAVMYKKEINSPVRRIGFDADFSYMTDEVKFDCGTCHKMYFNLSHFTGNRAGLFYYSSKKSGGRAKFSQFVLDNRC